MTPTPKSLILNLLLAADGAPLSASDAVNSAQSVSYTHLRAHET